MKKKKLGLEKIRISKLNNLDTIKGGNNEALFNTADCLTQANDNISNCCSGTIAQSGGGCDRGGNRGGGAPSENGHR